MTRRLRHPAAALIGLNAALLGALMLVTLSPGAAAQPRADRPRGEYTMVGARAQGITESAIFVIDATNQEMVALRWDRGQKTLRGIGYRDLAADVRRGEGRGR